MEEALPPVELSIEVFPPKGPEAAARLWANVEQFVAIRPRFISVTCGAGGSGADGTLPLVRGIQDTFAVPVAAHMTCAWSSREEIDALARGVLGAAASAGSWHCAAIPPKGAARYQPRPDGYAYASDLIRGLRAVAGFEISAGCYPEVHPEAASAEADLDNLRRKVEAGATRLVTQYCFDTDSILRFRDRLVAAGIEAEYVPGIMPIHSFSQIRRFSLGCGAGVPGWLERLFAGVEENSPDARHDRRQRGERAMPPPRRRGPDADARLRAQPRRAAAGDPPPPVGPRGAGGGMSDFLATARRRVVLLDGAMGSRIQAQRAVAR